MVICQLVVKATFLQVEGLGDHGHEEDLVDSDAVEHNFGAFLDQFIVILQVEERAHLLYVVLVLRHPVSELGGPFAIDHAVVGTVRRPVPQLFEHAALFEGAEHSSAARHDRVKSRPQLGLIFRVILYVVNMRNREQRLPPGVVFRQVEYVISWRAEG